MFSAIDWLLKQAAYYLSYGLTLLIKAIVGLLGINTSFWENEHYKSAVDFFFYDTMKIFLMLSVIIFIVSIIRSFFPPERTKKLLEEGFFATLLGIVTPFCSCSAVPVFIGFAEAGIPLGVTFSFLISSPMAASKHRCCGYSRVIK